MIKNKFLIKSTLAVFTFLFVALAAFSMPVFAKTTAQTQDMPSVFEENNNIVKSQKGSHVLEWAAFSVAAAEVAGMLGMGLSSIRKEKRKVKKQLVSGPSCKSQELPLPYEKYGRLKSAAVANR